jgi:hypothetical protein
MATVPMFCVSFHAGAQRQALGEKILIHKLVLKKVPTDWVGKEATARGYLQKGVAFIECGLEQLEVILPFSYVREPSPSLGWPSWFALDVMMVRAGWISKGEKQLVKNCISVWKDEEELFRSSIDLDGVLEASSKHTQDLVAFFDEIPKEAPFGKNILPVSMQLNELSIKKVWEEYGCTVSVSSTPANTSLERNAKE